jgi:hypothetical protein
MPTRPIYDRTTGDAGWMTRVVTMPFRVKVKAACWRGGKIGWPQRPLVNPASNLARVTISA